MTLVLQPDHKPAGAKMPVPGGTAPKGAAGGPRSAIGSPAGSGLNIPRPAAATAAPAPAAAPKPPATPEPAPVAR